MNKLVCDICGEDCENQKQEKYAFGENYIYIDNISVIRRIISDIPSINIVHVCYKHRKLLETLSEDLTYDLKKLAKSKVDAYLKEIEVMKKEANK